MKSQAAALEFSFARLRARLRARLGGRSSSVFFSRELAANDFENKRATGGFSLKVGNTGDLCAVDF